MLTTPLKPWTVDSLLSDIPGNSRDPKIYGDRNIVNLCRYDYVQYLFIYRKVLLKIIEILDCMLLENEKQIAPPKFINLYYPVLLFVYNHIGIGRSKFVVSQIFGDAGFDDFESLAGDIEYLSKEWKEQRSNYIKYKGRVENIFAMNGYKEFEVPVRLQILLEQVDLILDNQRKQYSPYKNADVKWKDKNTITHNGKDVEFVKKQENIRKKLISVLIKNKDGLSSKEIREKLNRKSEVLKSLITQINKRLAFINITIKYDKNTGNYRLVKTN